MYYFKDEQRANLLKAIERRWIDSYGIITEQKRMEKFANSYLLDFSAVGFTDENKDIRPYKYKDLMARVARNFGENFIPQAEAFSQELYTRLGNNTSKEDLLHFTDVNIPEARNSFNKLFMQAVKDRPTFKFIDYIGDSSTEYFSKSLNFYLQRMLMLGNYFSERGPSSAHAQLEMNTIAMGTGYLRINYNIGFNKIGRIQDVFNFSFVPIYEILDDGRYTSGTFNDIEESKFIIQVHTFDKESAQQLINSFKKNVDVSQYPTSYTAFLDENALWDSFGIEGYRTIVILEVFWKDFDEKGNYTWNRTFFGEKSGALEEIYSDESPYACGLPIIRLKHEVTSGTIYGYTPISNNINIDSVRNTIYSSMLNKTLRDNSEKLLMSNRIGNLKDEDGRYWHPFLPQRFLISNLLFSGNSPKNPIIPLQTPPLNSESLTLVEKINAENKVSYETPGFNFNRTGAKTAAIAVEQSNEIYQPMLYSRMMYNTQLGTKLYQILRKEYGEEERKEIRRYFGAIAEGVDLKMFDIDDKLPENIANSGVEVIMSSQRDTLKMKSMENIIPLLDRYGAEVLSNEGLIQLFDLRNAGFQLPYDKEKMYILRDIYLLKTGKEKEPKNLILKTIRIEQSPEGQPVEVIDYNIQNHKLAVDVIKQWLNEHKTEFMESIKEVQDRIYLYLDEHLNALEQNAAKAQAMTQQPPKDQGQQPTPEQLQQAMSQFGQQAPVQV